jgi:alpha-galactosidase
MKAYADYDKNNWNAFGCDVSEDLILGTSQEVVGLGLRDLGYNYIVLDDCWQDPKGRDGEGKVQPDLSRFPNGFKSISDHLHDQGLKYGMYSSAGEMTCARFGKLSSMATRELHQLTKSCRGISRP